MSSPDLTVPAGEFRAGVKPGRSARASLARLVRGAPADPRWSRPALIGVSVLAAALLLWGLTRNGYANTYYASAVYAGSKSWSALFYNAVDLSQYVSIDKTPLSLWMMALSARLFGFSSFSMLLPNALCGVGAVLVLHSAVRRTLGHRAALLAALFLALTPVTVLIGRFNNPDALLVLLLVCAAWAAVRAIESGRTRHVLLCGVLVGLAFNTKMLQAYLVVPALALPFLLAGRGRFRRRLAQLVAGAAAMLAVSAAWVGTMMLIPAGSRPYVGDSTTNSWWDLIFGANGLDRVGGGSSVGGGGPGGGGGGFGGAQGVLRLFNSEVGGQIAWLVPLAVVGLIAGLWIHRRGGRTDRARAAYVMWGTWAAVHFYVFSVSLNLFHPYYTSALAPAIAALAAGGVVALWDRAKDARVAVLLAASIIATAALSFGLLDRTPGFVPWLRWAEVIVAIVAAGAVLLARLAGRRRRVVTVVAVAAGLATSLAGPAAYAIATVGQTAGGGNPTAGPAVAQSGPGGGAFGPGPPPAPGARANGPPAIPGLAPGARGRAAGGPAGPGGGERVDKQLIGYLQAHRSNATYLVAANGSMTAAPIILATHQRVITIGGFSGQDPSPSITQLRSLIASGQLRYVLLGSGGGPGGPGGPPGAPGGRAGSQPRDAWVTSHCTPIKFSATTSGSGAQSLYDCSTAK